MTDVLESIADVWYLKNIEFGEGDQRKEFKIITQNFNGPCSFIAICNILILRGSIEIQPPTRRTVSYEFLSQLVAEYLLTNCPDVDISAALSIMPLTQKGMDLNPLFTGAQSFRPGGQGGGELKLFEQVGIELLHGWLVEPGTPEAEVLAKTEDYDNAAILVAEADHISKGQLVMDDSDIPQAGSSKGPVYSDEERQKIEDATIVRQFLDNTKSQLTYHGLFNLATTVKPGSLAALYRNLHLSVIYKRDSEEDTSLYTLVTDNVFQNEPSIVWERLEDIDGGWSTFVDSSFVRSSPAGGDYAGQTVEDVLRAAQLEAGEFVPSDPADLALAQQLQAEENQRAWQENERHKQEQERRRLAEEEKQRALEEKKNRKKGVKKDCIIM